MNNNFETAIEQVREEINIQTPEPVLETIPASAPVSEAEIVTAEEPASEQKVLADAIAPAKVQKFYGKRFAAVLFGFLSIISIGAIIPANLLILLKYLSVADNIKVFLGYAYIPAVLLGLIFSCVSLVKASKIKRRCAKGGFAKALGIIGLLLSLAALGYLIYACIMNLSWTLNEVLNLPENITESILNLF